MPWRSTANGGRSSLRIKNWKPEVFFVCGKRPPVHAAEKLRMKIPGWSGNEPKVFFWLSEWIESRDCLKSRRWNHWRAIWQDDVPCFYGYAIPNGIIINQISRRLFISIEEDLFLPWRESPQVIHLLRQSPLSIFKFRYNKGLFFSFLHWRRLVCRVDGK